jgi:tRNA threonylcarbamoyladenosine biosynthesis protein TsaE
MTIEYALENIDNAAEQLLQAFPTQRKFALHGELGAGKTSFVAAVCKKLGVQEEASSPTYAILQEYISEYNGEKILIAHMDWYRLKSSDDLLNAGILEYITNPDIYCFIEWPSQVPDAITEGIVQLYFTTLNDTTRSIKIS